MNVEALAWRTSQTLDALMQLQAVVAQNISNLGSGNSSVNRIAFEKLLVDMQDGVVHSIEDKVDYSSSNSSTLDQEIANSLRLKGMYERTIEIFSRQTSLYRIGITGRWQ